MYPPYSSSSDERKFERAEDAKRLEAYLQQLLSSKSLYKNKDRPCCIMLKLCRNFYAHQKLHRQQCSCSIN